MKFFLDHCISNSVARALEAFGHEVLKLRDCLPTDAVDSDVLDKAAEQDSILVSLNGDFADIVRYPPSEHQGIIALQVKNHPENEPAILEKMHEYLGEYPGRAHYRGKLLVVEAHRIRVRQ